jgi:tRNA (adenine37-N6)-methyltransferase
MTDDVLQVTPIGVIHSPFTEPKGTPIQPCVARGAQGTVVLKPEYVEGLSDLDGFERVWLLYIFDRSGPARLSVVPFRDTVEHGVFATRAPVRPNHIGMSAVRLTSVESNILHIEDIDVLDGTPLLDIKPYVPEYDAYECRKIGWLETASGGRDRADSRFKPKD